MEQLIWVNIISVSLKSESRARNEGQTPKYHRNMTLNLTQSQKLIIYKSPYPTTKISLSHLICIRRSFDSGQMIGIEGFLSVIINSLSLFKYLLISGTLNQNKTIANTPAQKSDAAMCICISEFNPKSMDGSGTAADHALPTRTFDRIRRFPNMAPNFG
jgi:hypothetical protein